MMNLYVKRLHPNAKLPTRASVEAAAYDLYSPANVDLPMNRVTPVPLGIATDIPRGMAGLIWDRSGMGTKAIHVFGGVVDSDYRGEWRVLLYNASGLPYLIQAGDRIAQVVFQRHEVLDVVESLDLTATARGEAGWGSTGR